MLPFRTRARCPIVASLHPQTRIRCSADRQRIQQRTRRLRRPPAPRRRRHRHAPILARINAHARRLQPVQSGAAPAGGGSAMSASVQPVPEFGLIGGHQRTENGRSAGYCLLSHLRCAGSCVYLTSLLAVSDNRRPRIAEKIPASSAPAPPPHPSGLVQRNRLSSDRHRHSRCNCPV